MGFAALHWPAQLRAESLSQSRPRALCIDALAHCAVPCDPPSDLASYLQLPGDAAGSVGMAPLCAVTAPAEWLMWGACLGTQCALAVGDDKLRPTIPSDTPPALVAVAGACFEPEPAMRPSFGVIVHRLTTFLSALPSSPGGSSADSTASIKRMFGWGGGGSVGDTTPSPTKRSPGAAAVNGHS